MTNETIVTLPKKVAEAMDEIKRGYGEGALRDLPQIYTLIGEGPPSYKTVIDYARSEDNLYFEAVVNGYQAEMTPEEKVAEYYESLFDANQFDKKEFVLVKTLNLLGINIPGVNVR